MANEFNNRVILADGTVLIDLTSDTVQAQDVKSGIKFHLPSGKTEYGTNTNTVDASDVETLPSEVLFGKPFGKGDKIEKGTMPDNSKNDVIIQSLSGKPIPMGFSDGGNYAKLSDEDLSKLKPENIKDGVSLFGGELVGSFGADDFSSTSKEITPTFTTQVFNPSDDGVVYYSSITVKPISITRTDNKFGGVTVTIGDNNV